MAESDVRYGMVPIDSLILDTNNPRIAQWIQMYTEVSDEALRLAVMRGGADDEATGPSFLALKQSIRTNGTVIHPIIINRSADRKMTVIEGNTRTLIYREFKKDKIPGNWDKIPAIIYENMTETQIDAIRLQAHLVGVREWDPYSKAKYLDTLRNKLNMPFTLVVDYCGGNQKEVEKLIAAYNDMEQYYRSLAEASDQGFDYKRFSGFVELQNQRITQALVTSGFTKADFAKWMVDRKFHPLQTIRRLPQIMHNENAKKIFLKDGAYEAIRYLDTHDQTTNTNLDNASFLQLSKEIYKRINAIQFSEIMRLKNEPEPDEMDILRDAKDALSTLWKEITAEE